MSDEEILRTMKVCESIAKSLDLEIEVGSPFKVLRGLPRYRQQLFVTYSVDGIHGFLVGWSKALDEANRKAT